MIPWSGFRIKDEVRQSHGHPHNADEEQAIATRLALEVTCYRGIVQPIPTATVTWRSWNKPPPTFLDQLTYHAEQNTSALKSYEKMTIQHASGEALVFNTAC